MANLVSKKGIKMDASLFCVVCGEKLTLDTAKHAYDDDDPYCADCLDELEEKAGSYWEGVYADQDIDRYKDGIDKV